MTDKYVEKFRQLSTFLAAYLRDVTHPMHHSIQAISPGAKLIGRAFTVMGPDTYLDALEAIPEGSVYVHAHTSEDTAVYSGSYGERFGRSRGLLGAVIDGGIHGRESTLNSDLPTFARFVTPNPAVNRRHGSFQVPVVCGGAPVCPGDIILADADGVVVIPQQNQHDIYTHLDGFLEGMCGLFAKLARQPDIVVTQHEALAEMFELKYQHPHDYWRHYEPWANKWRGKYAMI